MAHADLCRALAARSKTATLSTLTSDGFPFGSLVAIAFDEQGRPLLLLSSLAEHTTNLAACERASVMVHEPVGDEALAVARMTVVGRCARVPDAELEAARAAYLAAQPSAAQYASFKDFAFYRLEPVSVRYVGGFGKMSWVDAGDYRAARA